MDENESEQRPENELYETHPLDRDYSSPAQPSRGPAIEFDPKFRRIGGTVFAAGFLTVFLAAILLGNVRGTGLMESIASGVHRAAMILILIGGVLIIVAYRLPHIKGTIRLPDGKKIQWNVMRSYRALVFWNIVGFLVIVPASYLIRLITSPALYLLLVQGPLAIACAFMVTLVVWHRGFIRAYAIGVLVALVLNGSCLILFGVSARYWGSYEDFRFQLLGLLAITLISGLVCSGYVHLLESASSRKTHRVDNQPIQ